MVTKENRKQGREARRMSSRARTRPAHASVPATRPCFLLRTIPRGNPTRASPLSRDPCPVATPPPRVRVPPLLPAPCSWESPAWGGGAQQRPPIPPRPAGQDGPRSRCGHARASAASGGRTVLAPPAPGSPRPPRGWEPHPCDLRLCGFVAFSRVSSVAPLSF